MVCRRNVCGVRLRCPEAQDAVLSSDCDGLFVRGLASSSAHPLCSLAAAVDVVVVRLEGQTSRPH